MPFHRLLLAAFLTASFSHAAVATSTSSHHCSCEETHNPSTSRSPMTYTTSVTTTTSSHSRSPHVTTTTRHGTSAATRGPVAATCSPKAVDVFAGSYYDADCDLCSLSIADTEAFVPPQVCYQEAIVAIMTVSLDHNGQPTASSITRVSASTPTGYQVYTLNDATLARPTIRYQAIGRKGETPCYTITAKMVDTVQQTGSRYYKHENHEELANNVQINILLCQTHDDIIWMDKLA